MTVTTAELRNKVAQHVRIKGVDVELDAESAALIDALVADVSAEYREKGLIWWADNAIPDACVNAMKLIVAAWAAGPCGKAGQGYEAGEKEGRERLAALKPSAEIATLKACYF